MCEQIIDIAVELTAKNTHLQNYTFEVIGQTGKGDGYGSDINFVSVAAKDYKNTKKTLELAIKSQKQTLVMENIMKGAFDKEIYIYSRVLPLFEELQRENQISNIIDFMPKCYATISGKKNQALVFENLKAEGFGMHELTKPWSRQGTVLAMIAYGKWHALSFAMKILKPAAYEKVTENNVNMYLNVCLECKLFKLASSEFIKIRDKFIGTDLKMTPEVLNFTQVDVLKKLANIYFEQECLDKSVILHGDCWNNNYMFKYEINTQTPTEIQIIDWQCSGLASPVIDLSHHIFATANLADTEDIHEFLKVYYESFSNTLALFKCDAKEMFSYSELLDHWRKLSKYGFMLSVVIIKWCFPPKEYELDISKATDTDNLETFFNFDLLDETEFLKRLQDNFKFYYNNAE